MRWQRSGIATVLILAVAAFGAACGSGDDGTGPNGDGDGNGMVLEIQLTGSLDFEPDTVDIATGTTVRWVNRSGLFHTVTPDGHNEWAHHDMPDDETFEHTFDTEGTFPYYCTPHRDQGMVGEITVSSDGTGY